MSYFLLILFGLAVIAVFLLVAAGGLGRLEVEDDFAEPDLSVLSQVNLPIALFGYRRATVDKLLDELQRSRTNPNQ